MVTEPGKTFSRKFMGYDPNAVDTHIEMLTAKQQLLLHDVDSLRARLKESGDEVAALRKDVAALTETSDSPHAMQQRMAKMLESAVDEISDMREEAQAEAAALIADAEAEIDAKQHEHKELLADLATQRDAMEAEYEETKKKLDAELTDLRANAQAEIDEARQNAQHERERLLTDAKQSADDCRTRAHEAMHEATQRRITVLEQLMGVYRDLEEVPTSLESAYQELKDPAADEVVAPTEPKVGTG